MRISKKPSETSPVVLLPLGPSGWLSHRHVLPELVSLWKSLGFTILPTWFPEPRWNRAELDRLSRASALIFPIGLFHYQGLRTLKSLRKRHRIDTPACMMYSSDIHTGMRKLSQFEEVLRGTDCLVVNSSAELRLLHAFFPELGLRTQRIALPVNERIFRLLAPSRRRELRKSLSLPLNEKIILYAGRISTQKNIPALLSVFDRLRKDAPRGQQGCRLIILGDADDVGIPHFPLLKRKRCLEEVMEQINKRDLGTVVEFRPSVSQALLARYFNACDVHISLSTHSAEDFGYSIAQGLACRTPTVVTRWGGGGDLGGACESVRVKAEVSGPVIDPGDALRKIKKALLSGRLQSSEKLDAFSRREIAREWERLAAGVGEISRSIRGGVLGTSKVPAYPGFKNALDPSFKKYFKAYAGQADEPV